MSTAPPAPAVQMPLPTKPRKTRKPRKSRKPRPKKLVERVTCDRCGIEIGKPRFANHQKTLSCAIRTYNNECGKMMRSRGYVPIDSYYDSKIWRLLPEDAREIGPDPCGGGSTKTTVVIWVREEIGVVVNGALKARLDEKLLYRIAEVAVKDPELRAAMAAVFIMSPHEAFQQHRGRWDTATYTYVNVVNPQRQTLIEGLEQWVGDWESAQLPEEPTD